MGKNQQISKKANNIMPQDELLKHLMAYAKIDYMMTPGEDEFRIRVYHYCKNRLDAGHFFSINDSGGDHYHVLFSPDGCMIKGFDHECELSPYSWNDENPMPEHLARHNFYAGAPETLLRLLDSPDLEKELVTFCAWQPAGDAVWHYAQPEIPADWTDGIDVFLFYTGKLKEYQNWFEEYYACDLDKSVLKDIFDGKALTSEMVKALNEEGDNPEEVIEELNRLFA
jgi:hypothetical protein